MAHGEDRSRRGPLSRIDPSARILVALQQESAKQAGHDGIDRDSPVDRASTIRHVSLVHIAGIDGRASLFGLVGRFDLTDLIRFSALLASSQFADIIVSKTTCRHISRQLIPPTF